MKTLKYSQSDTKKRGVYPAVVDSVDEDDGKFGPQLKFIFKITDGKYADQTVWGWCGQSLTPKSKLTSWLPALLPDVQVGKGFELDPEDLVGRACKLVLGVKAGDDGIERNTIESLLPIEDEDDEADDEEAAPAPVARPKVGAKAPF